MILWKKTKIKTNKTYKTQAETPQTESTAKTAVVAEESTSLRVFRAKAITQTATRIIMKIANRAVNSNNSPNNKIKAGKVRKIKA